MLSRGSADNLPAVAYGGVGAQSLVCAYSRRNPETSENIGKPTLSSDPQYSVRHSTSS
jgi:hypothetical protein